MDFIIEDLRHAIYKSDRLPKQIKLRSEITSCLAIMVEHDICQQSNGYVGRFTGIPYIIDDTIKGDYELVYDGDYIIIGDTKDYKDCLICVCGSYDNAVKVLDKMLNNPDEQDKRILETHSNLRIKLEPEQDCWWNYGCD